MVQDQNTESLSECNWEVSSKRSTGYNRPPPREETLNLNLNRLTKAEKLWIWRRRNPSSVGRGTGSQRRGGRYGRGGAKMSANEAAAVLGVSPDQYCRAEGGENVDYVLDLAVSMTGAETEVVSYITLPEACALARRRSGASLNQLCASLGGISKPTFLKREAMAHPEVIAMWKARGYTIRDA